MTLPSNGMRVKGKECRVKGFTLQRGGEGMNEKLEIGQKCLYMIWFGLCCLMTPGPSKDIRCQV